MDAFNDNPRTNILSIVALVTSILGLAIVPIVLGHISLAQIKRTEEQGRAMAIIALVIGYISAVVYLVVIGVLVVALVMHGMSRA